MTQFHWALVRADTFCFIFKEKEVVLEQLRNETEEYAVFNLKGKLHILSHD